MNGWVVVGAVTLAWYVALTLVALTLSVRRLQRRVDDLSEVVLALSVLEEENRGPPEPPRRRE